MANGNPTTYVNFRGVAWAMSQHIAGLHRLALIEIARHANHSGHAWPSMRTLADRLGVTPRHCRRIIAELEATALILRINDNGRRQLYQIDPQNTAWQSPSTFDNLSPLTPDTHVRGTDQTPDTHVRPPRTPMSGVTPDTHVRLRVPVKTIENGHMPVARSAYPPTAKGKDSPEEDLPKMTPEHRQAERQKVKALLDKLTKRWRDLDIGPLTRTGRTNTDHRRTLAAILAPAERTYGLYELIDVVSYEIEQARLKKRRTTLETVTKKALTQLKQKHARKERAR